MVRFLWGSLIMSEHKHNDTDDHAPGCGHKVDAPAQSTVVTDLVCGMKVDPATSKHRFDHAGTTYHFCSSGCRTIFEADPAKYLAA